MNDSGIVARDFFLVAFNFIVMKMNSNIIFEVKIQWVSV